MERDPIIEEIHAVREAFAKEHNYDLAAMVATLRRHQCESGREVVSFAPRRLSTNELRPVEATSAAHPGDGAAQGPRKASA
ncbi:MAG TPA: hypothetical protein VLX28_01470 [Thermoanaerobaculia bacterium]|nr:hypothetical protein [Thermoanaerobaculia bacterium]